MKKMNLFFRVFMISSVFVLIDACREPYYDDFDYFEEDISNDFDSESNTSQTDFIALYEIQGNGISKIKEGNASKAWMSDELKHREIFNRFTELIDAGERPRITQFIVFDGEGELYGYVEPLDDNLNEWVMGLAIDVAYKNGIFDADGEMTYTIIHEFAHVLTLNNGQLEPGKNNCSTYNPGEGCSDTEAYINQFVQNYWNDILDEHNRVEPGDYDALDNFYKKYQSHFVTDYAATNPAEDIAESFTAFVTGNSVPNGNSIADQKVKFMYQYPELKNLRDHMKIKGHALKRPDQSRKAACRHSKNGRITVATK